jgi:transketolase
MVKATWNGIVLAESDETIYASAEGVQRGGYVLWLAGDATPDAVLMGSGSETRT